MNDTQAFCSWCFENTMHSIASENQILRDTYICNNCKGNTVVCRIPGCRNMARGEAKWTSSEEQSMVEFIKTNWDNELCAEHDGTIASFEKLTHKLDRLEDYKDMFNREKWNWEKGIKYSVCIVGGIAIIGMSAGTAAPGLAAALGSTGLLGAASTGTAICTLSGAALTNASLAAIGGGALAAGGFGMTGGLVILTATGAALGGAYGGALSNNYFGEIQDFDIKQVRSGLGPTIFFINGFLSQKNQDSSDWLAGIREHYPDNPCYQVTWESKTNADLGMMVTKGIGALAFNKFVRNMVEKNVKKAGSKLNPVTWFTNLTDLISNPWHTAMVKAMATGILLADIIPRVNNKDGFILMGHSLGCRVVYYVLQALSSRKEKYIRDVHLFGGAVANGTKDDWRTAVSSVDGYVNNYYSQNDDVLNVLYRTANVWSSEPIGYSPISLASGSIHNINVTDIVEGHLHYKKNLAAVLKRCKTI